MLNRDRVLMTQCVFLKAPKNTPNMKDKYFMTIPVRKHKNINSKTNLLKVRLYTILASLIFGSMLLPQIANAQSTTDMFTPLIPGALSSPPGIAPIPGSPPPIGSGMTPVPVTPGMTGAPTLLPWVNNVPANTMGIANSTMTLPVAPSVAMAPGTLGPSLTGSIPGPPSTPGANPGMLNVPANYNLSAAQVSVNAGGSLPNGAAPIYGRGGQATRDFGLPKYTGSLTTDFGQPLTNNPYIAIQPQFSQNGPRAANYPGQINSINRASNLPNAQETEQLYGSRILFKGPNLPPQSTIAPY